MIVVVSGHAQERMALTALCESRGWPVTECSSLRGAKKLFRHTPPGVVLVRQKLGDGYSDDVLAVLGAARLLPATKVVVLLPAGAPSALAARQIALGADSVVFDPVRTDVLLAYIARYKHQGSRPARSRAGTRSDRKTFQLASAIIHPIERRLEHRGRRRALTPREVQLAELLFDSSRDVVTYETLFSEILGRKFRGETSNLRVLLGKLDASFRSVGLTLRTCLEVIPKTGYRYIPPSALRPARADAPRTSPP